jgi:hypothetical protein
MSTAWKNKPRRQRSDDGSHIVKAIVEENQLAQYDGGEHAHKKVITQLKFGMFSPLEMMKLSEFPVTSNELFEMPSRNAARNGCLDPRLGVSDKKSECATCNRKLADCAGHYGHIKLELPVFHVGFLKHTIAVLQSTCHSCFRVLLTERERETFVTRLEKKVSENTLVRQEIFKKVHKICKDRKSKSCPHCGAPIYEVKKVDGCNTFKVSADRRKKNVQEESKDFEASLAYAESENPDVRKFLSQARNDYHPLRSPVTTFFRPSFRPSFCPSFATSFRLSFCPSFLPSFPFLFLPSLPPSLCPSFLPPPFPSFLPSLFSCLNILNILPSFFCSFLPPLTSRVPLSSYRKMCAKLPPNILPSFPFFLP